MLGYIDDEEIISIFEVVIRCLPTNSQVYLVGGSMRNAMFYKYHGTHLPQRDFDISFTSGNLQIFKKKLLTNGFELGKLNTATGFTVKKKIGYTSLIKNGYVYLDVSTDTSYSSRQFNKSDSVSDSA